MHSYSQEPSILNKPPLCIRALFAIIAPLTFALPRAAPAAEPVHYDIFLMAGQSNMDGRAAVADLTGDLAPYATPRPDILIYFSAGGLHRPLVVSHGFQPLQPGYSEPSGSKATSVPGTAFGPEVSFGPAIAAALPGHHILLVKFAEGGTNLRSDWNPNEKDKLYDHFIRFIRKTQEMIKANGDTCEIRGMVWHQGESDSKEPASLYQSQLTELIARVRGDVGLPRLSFVIGQVYDNGQRDTVIAAQKAVTHKIPNTALASADGLKTIDKGTHLDARSQITMGLRCAQAMAQLLNLHPAP
jgi:iduronate 2-sulfatase